MKTMTNNIKLKQQDVFSLFEFSRDGDIVDHIDKIFGQSF